MPLLLFDLCLLCILNYIFGTILSSSELAVDVAWTLSLCSVCWWKLLILLLRWRRRKVTFQSDYKNKTEQLPSCRKEKRTHYDFCGRTLSLCGTLLFIFFLLFIMFMNLGGNKLYMAFHWWSGDLRRESLKCGKEKTGCMMSMFAIPIPLALRIALQPLFLFFLFHYHFLSWSSHGTFCMWKKITTTSLLRYLFLNPSKNTSKQGKRS